VFCTKCGILINDENASFCRNCGNALKAHNVPDRRQNYDHYKTDHTASRSPRKKSTAAVALAIFLAVGLVAGTLIIAFSVENIDIYEGKMEIQTAKGDEYFELRGGFLSEEGIFEVKLTEEGMITFALTDNISSKYNYYRWQLFDRDSVSSASEFLYIEYTGKRLERAGLTSCSVASNPGEYDVSVDCYVEQGGNRIYKKTYSGIVSYIGNITKEYTWEYNETEYNASVTFGYDEYRQFRQTDVKGRAVTNYKKINSFVTYDEAPIVELSDSLRGAYGRDKNTNDQDFAQFVLSFVQICFDYPPNTSMMCGDLYQYGKNEYYAYPIETIFYGMGDCEDTSILCTALFKALGYNAGIAVVPEHAVSVVGLDDYSPEPYPPNLFEILSQTINGVTYYACETTVDNPRGIGYMSLSGHNGEPYSSYIGKQGYGFYILESES